MATLTRAVRDRLWHILLATLLVILGLVVYTIINLHATSNQLKQQAKVVDALSSNLAAAQAQLKQHGIQPAQPAPSQIIAQVGPPGAVGATGPEGREGPSGAGGAPGPAGPNGPAGPAGPSGASGPSGPTGTLGGQGPSGPAGPSGPPGPTGPSGAQGSAGEPGSPGGPGPSGPAPSGWVYVETPPIGNPRTHTCAPSTEGPSPYYSCS